MHVHILPRRFKGDRFEHAPDDVYPELDKTSREMGQVYAPKVSMPAQPSPSR